MNNTEITTAAKSLLTARRTGPRLEAFPAGCAPSSIDDAYAIQDALVDAFGEQPIGWKVGCTNSMAQKMSKIDEPFFGRIFASTTFDSPATMTFSDMLAPIIEPEIGFRLAQDLPPAQTPYTLASIIDAVDAMYPVVEVADCHYASSWPIAIEPTIADNGAHAAFIMGAAVSDWRSVDCAAVQVRVMANDETIAGGLGSNVLGNPLNSLVWLANACSKRGRTLRRGELITTGNTVKAPIFGHAGDAMAINFEGMGEVNLRFV